uniref:AAA+ ATPase domain-containing protein n=1 Tax=viral metagenome TaxID=1070528 RepID=A0A6C0E195_9ZZZZ
METLNMNYILNREHIVTEIQDILTNFEKNKHNLMTKKGIYVYGDPGSGKTTFVVDLLKNIGYDVIKYDAGDIRNKSIIETITKHNMSDKNVISMFYKKVKQLAIVMDEIDGMNNGDKGGINSLIKLIRPKKTKKQKSEDITLIPIVCIGNYHIDKKIKELMKVCHVIELKTPTTIQIKNVVQLILPQIQNDVQDKIIQFIQCDLRKLKIISELYYNNNNDHDIDFMNHIFQLKSCNEDTRKITKKLINTPVCMSDHLNIMNETDRTIVALLWHENIIDVLNKLKKEEAIPFYLKMLHNICFADYIDRVTFQKQIWQFNEMSSLIKTFQNNKLFHDTFQKKPKYNPPDVRFTKVLTKYSTEYNNSIFIQDLCQQLGMDKSDLFSFFLHLKGKHNDVEIMSLFENYEITKLDIYRMFRYLDKYTNENATDNPTDVDDCSVSSYQR